MAGTEQLPVYALLDPVPSPRLTPPPPSHDNAVFKIGTRAVVNPLVPLEQLKSHLRLLGMFASMKQKIEDPDSDPQIAQMIPPLAKALSPEKRWKWFLELAVERFERWAASLNESGEMFILPPIDVWIVWHTYMLNPSWYTEDCERLPLLRALRNLKDDPIDLVAKMGDDPFSFRPPPEQEAAWIIHARLPYNPFTSCAVHTHVDIDCPQCEKSISVPFLNPGRTGFAQADFNVVCGDCSALATQEKLGVAKFTRDAVLDPENPADVSAYGKAVYLPGTLLMTSGQFSTTVAKETKAKLKRVAAFRNDQDGRLEDPRPYPDTETWKRAMGDKLKYKTAELRKNLESCLTAPKARKITGAYLDGRPFSVPLVASVMRQTKFTEKMRLLGWLTSKFIDNPESVRTLGQSLMRYYGFLTLIPDIGSFSVPTLDIDLVWHTHQLSPNAYKQDCDMYVGKFVTHDDQVGESFLSDGFELTCRAWESRFGNPYTHCGCALPGATFGERLRKLRRIVLSQRPRVVPQTDHGSCSSSTHPSDHNSVPIDPRVRKQRRAAWKLRWQRKRNREAQKMKSANGQAKSKDPEEREVRIQGQNSAVAAPLSLMEGYGYPFESSEFAGLSVGDLSEYAEDESMLSCPSTGLNSRSGSLSGSSISSAWG